MKTKKVIKVFFMEDYKHIEQYLVKMAKDGWLLESIKNRKYIFVESEPRNLEFNVSILYEEGFLDYPDKSRQEQLNLFCEENGWKYCTHNSLLQIFYKECGAKSTIMHTDPEIEFQLVKSAIVKTQGLLLIIPFIYLFIIYNNIKTFSCSTLLSYSGFFNFIGPIFIFVIFLILLFSSLHWIIKNYIRIKEGRNLYYSSSRIFLIKKYMYLGFLLMYLGIFILSLSSSLR